MTQKGFERIYLLGYMGSGKSTLGKRLAKVMDYKFVDIDQVFEKKFKTDIHEFFKYHGEQKFRALEREILHKTFTFSKCIISTGGGTPCFNDNMEQILQHGFAIYLQMPPEALYRRLMQTKRVRPLTSGLDNEQLLDFINKNLEKRAPFYERSHLCVSGINLKPKDIETIISYYKKYGIPGK